MKAIVLSDSDGVRVSQVADATLRDPTSALVRMTCTSICGSDLHLVHRTVPAAPGTVLGHECVGEVEDVGSEVRRFRRGDRVILPGVIGCGGCAACRAGYAVGCLNQAVKVYGTSLELPGVQAEAVNVPAADFNLWPAPSDLTDEQVLFLTDILPTGYFAAQNAGIQPGDTVVVIGCGPVGLAAIVCAQLFGPARILAFDRVPYRLEQARAFGATAIDTSDSDPRTHVYGVTDGRGADAAIEAVGSTATVQLAFDLVRIGGRVSVVGVVVDPAFPFPMGTALLKDVTFRIGLVNVGAFIPPLLELVRSGRIDPTLLISHRLALAEGERAYHLFDGKRDNCLKVVLRPS